MEMSQLGTIEHGKESEKHLNRLGRGLNQLNGESSTYVNRLRTEGTRLFLETESLTTSKGTRLFFWDGTGDPTFFWDGTGDSTWEST